MILAVLITTCMLYACNKHEQGPDTPRHNTAYVITKFHFITTAACLIGPQQVANLCSAGLEEQLTAAKQQCARQQSQLVDAQARHTDLTQALEQQLSTKQTDLEAALQLLESAKQTAAQLEAAGQQQSDRVAELESTLEASQDAVASANTSLASQTEKTAGTITMLCIHLRMCLESDGLQPWHASVVPCCTRMMHFMLFGREASSQTLTINTTVSR